MDTIEEYDGTTWLMFTWPMLTLLVVIALLAGVVAGGLIERVSSRNRA